MTAKMPAWTPREPWPARKRLRRRLARHGLAMRPVGLTGAQRLRAWSAEYEERLVKEAQAYGIYELGQHSRKWYSERIRELERLGLVHR